MSIVGFCTTKLLDIRETTVAGVYDPYRSHIECSVTSAGYINSHPWNKPVNSLYSTISVSFQTLANVFGYILICNKTQVWDSNNACNFLDMSVDCDSRRNKRLVNKDLKETL